MINNGKHQAWLVIKVFVLLAIPEGLPPGTSTGKAMLIL